MRFGQIVILYFVIGSTMWAGGVIQWEQAGIGNYLIDAGGERVEQNNAAEDLTELKGPIEEAASTVDNLGLLAVWNVFVKLIGWATWPITVLQTVSAPVEIVVLLGGTVQMGFVVSLLRTVRSSA
jgi:hypothetical protein